MTQHPVVADLAVDIALECMDSHGNSHILDTVLAYNRHDAYAVSMTFKTDDEPLTWTFARDLLITGMRRPVGSGDVHVAPAVTRGRNVLLITFSSPDGQLLLMTSTAPVTAFIEATLDMVAVGTESHQLDMDDLIAQLLA